MTASYTAICTTQASHQTVDTSRLFCSEDSETVGLSPIDRLISNTNKVNLLYMGSPTVSGALGPLVILGYVSAVESYMRALLRGVVNVDEYAATLVEPMSVPYGAALHFDKASLAESLLEDVSFASSSNVRDALKRFTGIKGRLPADVETAFEEFQKICEIRHCCVHRFGRLGAKNAIALGLRDHAAGLDRPVSLSKSDLEAVGAALRTFSKVVNNYVFRALLERSVVNRNDNGNGRLYSVDWTWSWRADKPRFVRYYRLFASTLDAIPASSSREIYESLRVFSQSRNSR